MESSLAKAVIIAIKFPLFTHFLCFRCNLIEPGGLGMQSPVTNKAILLQLLVSRCANSSSTYHSRVCHESQL